MDTTPTVKLSSAVMAPSEPEKEARSSTLPSSILGTRAVTVCLTGMPNAGKTALMNSLTGGHFHTANYPGVTVTLSKGKSKPQFGPEVTIVDLPGVHSTVAQSPEEELSCRVLEGRHPSVQPDALILVLDATQLERHIKFAGYAARMGKPMVAALTMTDMLGRTEQTVNVARLAAALRLPVVAVDGRTGFGVEELMQKLYEALQNPQAKRGPLADLPDDAVASYKIVREMLDASGAVKRGNLLVLAKDALTSRIDSVVLHRVWGFPIFLAILVALFASIFWVAQPFMDLIEAGFGMAGQAVARVLPEGVLARFIGEGVIGGVGAVAVFFPQIVILFFLMNLLEDSGYLARGAALVDKPLSYLGLHGRSFVPMLSGYACAIPAVLAARTIPSKRERMLTIWILPLMSCSARLPVYALLLAALLPGEPLKAGLALAAIYVGSLVVGAMVAGLISRLFLRKRSASMLAMELPAYRKPLVKPTLRMTWVRSSSYLKRAGTPIVVISAILWLLSNFGLGSRQVREAGSPEPPFIAVSELDHSFAAQLGQTIEPALYPMGVDWRVGVGLISAFAAREVFVSSMAIVFNVAGDEDLQQDGLLEQMRSATFENSSRPIFTTATMIGLIIFFFFSLQCLSTVAVIKSETGSWQMAAAQLLFYTGLGYLLASGAVQVLRLLGIQ